LLLLAACEEADTGDEADGGREGEGEGAEGEGEGAEGEGEGAEGEGEGAEGEGAEGEGEGAEGEGEGAEGEGEGACQPLAADGERVAVRFDPDGEFFARPFPDDSRLDAQGHPQLADFPNPGGVALLTHLAELTERENTGWANNGALFVTFTGSLHPDSLPATPDASRQPSSSLFLVELADDGTVGPRIPLQIRYQDEATLFLPPHTVAAYPVPGFVLAGGKRHLLAVTTRVRDAACRPLLAATGELAERLTAAGLDPQDLAGAALFTPQDVITPMQKLRDAVDAIDFRAPEGMRHIRTTATYDIYQGSVRIPNFQRGEPPYLTDGSGGDIVWDEAGRPQVQRQEQVRFTLTIPNQAGEMPRDGWPVVIYAHGTGGDYRSVITGVAPELADRGVAALGFDQVLHGLRDPTGSPPELTFFNIFNMVAGRDNVRQGGVDALAFQRLVPRFYVTREMSPTGDAAMLDPDRVAFLGHSQGGLTGAPFVAVAGNLRGAVFSGSSGGMNITILERADLEFAIVPGVTRYKDLVEQLLGIYGQEELDLFHPALTLLQTFIEPADTLGYGPYFHRDRKAGEEVPFLLLEGFLDTMAPAIGAEALAVAAGADLLEPVARDVEGLRLLGREPLTPPCQANWDGITAGLAQYPDDGHFALFDNDDARARSYDFLLSALTSDMPTIR
jgi:predicted esterase